MTMMRNIANHDSESEKLKASNFPAMLLKIGNWERVSMREGDLVAKCYYAKRKLVWEFLEGALKNKIELQWSDIIAIRAVIHVNEPSVLEIELNQPPLFFKETNPQPRKHTVWEPVRDFTRDQASIWRRHYGRFAPGMLDKHYDKLLQCDERLYLLSKRGFPSQESPYFESDYTLSRFSPSGYGSEYCRGFHQIRPTPLPLNHALNFKPAHLRGIVDLDSPNSVMDFAREPKAPPSLGINYAEGISDIPQDQVFHSVNPQLLSDIESYLLCDSQAALLNEEIIPVATTHEECDGLHLSGDARPYPELINCFPTHSSTGSSMMIPSVNSSVCETYPTNDHSFVLLDTTTSHF